MSDSDLYKIALSIVPKVGPKLARRLVAYTGSLEAVFTEKKKALSKVPGIGENIVSFIDRNLVFPEAEKELKQIEEKNIKFTFYLDQDYPRRLKECEDGPVVLYYKGKNCFNNEKSISIVGTRRSTDYGETMCSKLVQELSVLFPDLVIVSGFAYGIDICAHKAALQRELPTVAVFGHGLDTVYPSSHSKYIKALLEKGSLVTEFTTGRRPDAGNFVSRNRIIAGLADATIVVESGETGGALITADMAESYNRDVFAFPGRATDTYSKGCNKLIKNNKAALIESASDLIYYMKWDMGAKTIPVQQKLFEELPEKEQLIFNVVKSQDSISLDQLALNLKMPVAAVSSSLLTLEFKGLVKSLPGKMYKVN
jgi:DNA processing protein